MLLFGRIELSFVAIICSALIFTLVESRRNIDQPVFFSCNDGKKLQYEAYCDGSRNCLDGEDEITSIKSPEQMHRCVNPENDHDGFCLVSREQVCTSKVMCSNLTPCDLNCDSHYRCNNGTCLLRNTVCDNDPCSGCEEDHGWSNGVGFKCARSGVACVLPQQLLYDNVSDCDNSADLCFGDIPNLSRDPSRSPDVRKCFRCLRGDMIIATVNVCDGIIDCSDMSDECACASGAPEICHQVVTKTNQVKKSILLGQQEPLSANTTSDCLVGEIRCKNEKCIRTDAVCDGILDCGEDETFEICRGTIACKDATKTEKCRCDLDREEQSCRSVSATACDGIADCPPPQLHGWQIWTLDTFPEDECNATCISRPSPFTCETTQSIHFRQRLYGAPCILPDVIDPSNAYTDEIEGWQYCDGVIDCELSGSDEDECEKRFYCNVTKLGYVSIREDQVCDGIIDCIDGKDESAARCSRMNDMQRFSCPALGGKMVSIDASHQCNSYINCDDAADEMGCDDGRFYCENGEAPLFVTKNQVQDGISDCTDWSDECPTIDGSTSQGFSSRTEMIDNPWLRVMVWIMGVVSIVGNGIVIFHEASRLRRPARTTPARTTLAIRANRILILNLAVSDFLMGVYLLSLGIVAVKLQGVYCSKDNEWRAGSFCVSLGIISVVSGESSVMTMVILTGCRLYAVLRPFKSSIRPSQRTVILLICVSWALSLILAFLPVSSHLAHIFIAGVDFIFNPFVTGTDVSLHSAKNVFSKVMSYYQWNSSHNEDLHSFLEGATWQDLQETGNRYGIQYFNPKTYWGYYSAASVCIPKFFITTSDPAWVFSLIVNLFNILAFSFVAVSYVIIYIKSKRNPSEIRDPKADRKQMKSIQRKVLRLVATDFCCWVPICVMAFVKLAGHHVSEEAYAFAAIILLPLNSALNPILYSDFLDSAIHRTIVAFRAWTSSLHSPSTVETSNRHPESDEQPDHVRLNARNDSVEFVPPEGKVEETKLSNPAAPTTDDSNFLSTS